MSVGLERAVVVVVARSRRESECVKMEDGGMEDVRAVSVSECDCRRVAVRDGFRRAKAAGSHAAWMEAQVAQEPPLVQARVSE